MAKKSRPLPEFHHAAAARARREEGQDRRAVVSLESHATVPSGRDDAMDIITGQDVSRVSDLVPIRHGRMSVSPFTFYRATAAVMAADLARTPTTDLTLQICGDAHLSNFGVFAGPDRRLVFDLNDFDETLPGPFEWDVKRLAASITVAGRHNDFREKEIRRATRSAVTAYREGLDRLSQIAPLALNYRRIEIEPVIQSLKDPTMRKRADKVSQKAMLRDSIAAVGKLTEIVNGRHQIVSRPPLILRLDQQLAATGSEEIQEFFGSYLSTLPHHRRHVLSHYAVVDVAHKIVGVGSVGTRCMIVLLESGDGHPLFLQFKEAGPSVLEAYCGASPYAEHGERVVQGQRLMQTTGDIFLGWSQLHRDGDTTDFYFRQLWDGKGSFDAESMRPAGFEMYASVCGDALALAHARCGDASMISGYLGTEPTFDEAVTDFASGYADIVEADHGVHAAAIASGRIEAILDI
jgi:Uncharacterized protein conserved in bacteria (DUF2252)